jgi:hypothetical protein
MSQITLGGSDVLMARLLALPEKVKTQAIKKAINEMNKLLVGEARLRVPIDSGALFRLVGSVTRQYKGGRIVLGVVGAEIGQESVTIGGRTMVRKPYKYSHLIEDGTVQRKTKSGVNRGKVTPRPFLQPAFSAIQHQFQAILEKNIQEAFDSM